MKARALIVPGGATLTIAERAAGALTGLERAEVTGEGATWEQAQAACPIPEGAVILYWIRGE